MELSDIKINIDFENLIPKQTAEQFKQLEENMVSEGRARNPLVVWRGHDTLVDGHHRLRILKAHPELKWSVAEQDFTDEDEVKEWIIKNALGTRNLKEAEYRLLVATLMRIRKGKRGNHAARGADGKYLKGQNEPLGTAEEIAKEIGVSESTVKRAERFADGLENAENAVPGIKEMVVSGELKAQRNEVMAWRDQTPEEIKKSVQDIKDRKGKKKQSDKAAFARIKEIDALASGITTTQYGLAELIREVDALGDSFILSLSSMIKRRKNVMDSYDGSVVEIKGRIDNIIEKLNEMKGEI